MLHKAVVKHLILQQLFHFRKIKKLRYISKGEITLSNTPVQ